MAFFVKYIDTAYDQSLYCSIHSHVNSCVYDAWCVYYASPRGSGVVEGERGGTPFPQLFCWGNDVPPPPIMTWGNADTVAFPQIGLQRNKQSRK